MDTIIKEAFSRVKEDIEFLNHEINNLKKDIEKTREQTSEITYLLKNFLEKTKTNRQTDTSTHNKVNSTIPTHPSTHKAPLKSIKEENLGISTGNEGVSTNRQTDKQTNQQTDKSSHNLGKEVISQNSNSIEDAAKILDSLDDLKKDIRLKFKRLTDQEMVVFTYLYQMSENKNYVDYRILSNKLKLSESSIRDYVRRLIKKGIPVEKEKINNKTVRLSISSNLRKIATLPTIMQLREI